MGSLRTLRHREAIKPIPSSPTEPLPRIYWVCHCGNQISSTGLITTIGSNSGYSSCPYCGRRYTSWSFTLGGKSGVFKVSQ
jgi:transcription elongation factor Elf1